MHRGYMLPTSTATTFHFSCSNTPVPVEAPVTGITMHRSIFDEIMKSSDDDDDHEDDRPSSLQHPREDKTKNQPAKWFESVEDAEIDVPSSPVPFSYHGHNPRSFAVKSLQQLGSSADTRRPSSDADSFHHPHLLPS